MNFLLKVFISIILAISFLWILFTSFFSSGNAVLDNSILHHNVNYPISKSTQSGSVQKTSYSAFEDIYSFWSGSVELAVEDTKKHIDLHNSRLISSLRDINSEYTFVWKNFILQQEGIGEIFIDTKTSQNKVFVLALTAWARISLIGENEDTVYTTISLLPHMYLEFQPVRWKFLKNADRIRIETIYNLWYLPESLKDVSSMSENSTLERYFRSSQDQDAFKEVYASIWEDVKRAEKKIQSFKNASIYRIPGYLYIQRYMSSFVNKEKQKVFYKNVILEWFSRLLSSPDMKKSDIDSIRKDIAHLKTIDSDSYKEIQDLHTYLYSLIIRSTEVNSSEIKKIFSAFWYEWKEVPSFYLHMYSLFGNYDMKGKFSKKSYSAMLGSYGNFASTSMTEYFIYLLEKQLSFFVSNKATEVDLDIVLENYNYFIGLTDDVYKWENSKILTWVYIHADILSKIRIFLEKWYFLEKRDDDKLLQVKNTSYTRKSIQDLEELTRRSLAFYNKNLWVLSPNKTRDTEIRREISKSSEMLTEYFLALQNPEEYRKRYDTRKRDSLNILVWWNQEENKLTEMKARQYLEQFVGASLQDTAIEVSSNKYSVRNFSISGKNFDFELFPTGYNLMTSIKIDGVKQPYEYQLDIKKDEWDEKYKTASEEEKNKYDFSRFFLLTFFQQNNSQAELYLQEWPKTSEDKTEIVFKRDILLGERWEFASIRSFFPIQYSHIRLEKKQSSYAIYIEKSPYNISMSSWNRDVEYTGEISSQYVLWKEEKDRYFTGLQFTVWKQSSSRTNMLLWGNVVNISWRVMKDTLKQYLEMFLVEGDMYNSYYQSILQLPSVNIISMKYSPATQKMTYRLEKSWKTYTILTDNQGVSQILLWTKRLLSKPIDISEISDYIK